jgi:hypothetical protein
LAKLSFNTKPPESKGLLKKSIENTQNAGIGYLLPGDLYAHNIKSYGENGFEHSFVFMVAVDYYYKANKS